MGERRHREERVKPAAAGAYVVPCRGGPDILWRRGNDGRLHPEPAIVHPLLFTWEDVRGRR